MVANIDGTKTDSLKIEQTLKKWCTEEGAKVHGQSQCRELGVGQTRKRKVFIRKIPFSK
jgi:hypothetical protein